MAQPLGSHHRECMAAAIFAARKLAKMICGSKAWYPLVPYPNMAGQWMFIPLKLRIILVGGLEHVLFSHMLGISSSQLTNSYFFRGVAKNHQPEMCMQLTYDTQGLGFPTIGDFEWFWTSHHRNKYLLEIVSPIVGWCSIGTCTNPWYCRWKTSWKTSCASL